jgi:dTDP-4-amino-4,6-dideoxygalactose transaminase
MLDLQRLHRSIRCELDAAVGRVVDGASFVGGGVVAEFEEAFGAAHGTGPGAGCGSGTDALALALRALGIGPGHEVVVPSMTFVATAEAVVHAGATPVVADVDPGTLLLTPEAVAAVRTERTTAVVPVHLYGHVVPFDHLRRWRHDGLVVVEDAAQAHLARWRGQPVGSVGHAACFSFYPGKNLGALGDGGMVLSSDPAVAEEVRRVRDHGRVGKHRHEVVGYCSRLDGIQAAALQVKLGHLGWWTAARVERAGRYRDRLGDALVPWEDGAVHHLLVIRHPRRDRLQAHLEAAGIGTGLHYPIPLSRQPWLAATSAPTPAAGRAAREVLSLPMDPLLPLGDLEVVCDAVEGPALR